MKTTIPRRIETLLISSLSRQGGRWRFFFSEGLGFQDRGAGAEAECPGFDFVGVGQLYLQHEAAVFAFG